MFNSKSGPVRGLAPFLFITAILISHSVAAKNFVDPTLDAWLTVSPQQSGIDSEKRTVIVYLKSPNYQDHSGLARPLAIMEEEFFEQSYLNGKADELVQLTNGENVDKLWSSNALIMRVDRAGLRKLRHSADIDGVVADRIITLDEPKQEFPPVKTDESKMTYGLQLLHVKEVWDQGITGAGVTVGVIDTGVEDTHPDLAGKILKMKDFSGDGELIDHVGHGTHVCGTIAGGNTSGRSIGVAPGAKIILAKVFNSQGQATTSVLLRAMEWMLDPDGNPSTDDAPRIVSNSWGGSTQFSYGFRNAVRAWRRFEIFPNFAAGNAGSSYFSVGAPGSYPFSFAIGAIDENSLVTFFSSRGPTIWWKVWHPIFVTKPDISAPGLQVTSSLPGKTYGAYSGTSMATPHVAGVLALALQANPKLKVEDLETILKQTAEEKGRVNNKYGAGIIRADRVVAKAKNYNAPTGSTFSDENFQDVNPKVFEWDTP